METWLASIGPEVIEAWLQFAAVEPDAFAERGEQAPERQESLAPQMLPAAKAAELFGRRYG